MKTTLRKLVSEIDFDNKQLECSPDWEELGQLFEIYDLTWSNDERLKKYYIKPHYCTDTWVGTSAYFLDGEFIAISTQSGRKSNEFFRFVSKKIGEKVHAYLQTLVEVRKPTLELLEGELDVEIEDTYTIVYNTELLQKTAIYNGEKVEIIKTYYCNEGINSPKYFHTVEIKTKDGNKEVDCRELKLKYNSLD